MHFMLLTGTMQSIGITMTSMSYLKLVTELDWTSLSQQIQLPPEDCMQLLQQHQSNEGCEVRRSAGLNPQSVQTAKFRHNCRATKLGRCLASSSIQKYQDFYA